ncbi:MAG: divalent-cation tolerance protein CutA [Desulfovibrionaceae bacterium]|nr:divalent-cation tolerance protein CutA [Desulfovibrionaceae bacterium]
MQYILVYVTVGDQAEAGRIAAAVVGEKLAACANIIAPMRSLYWWEEKLEEAEEVVLLLKSELGLFETLRDRVCALHSYDVPCIVALPILAGSPDYLNWLGGNMVTAGGKD